MEPEKVEESAEETTETPTPEETATEEAAEETTEETTEPVEETTPDLYEVSDGRQLTGAQLREEYTKLNSDYTRKSQKLSEYEKVAINKEEEKPAWQNSDYEPKSWQEVIETAKTEIQREQALGTKREQERIQQLETSVQTQLDEIKKIEPNIDENALFVHAMKYKFGADNVSGAFQNMSDMKKVVLKTEKRTAENIKRRAGEPIATGGGQPSSDDGYDPNEAAQYSGALDFLKTLKK